MSLKPVTFQGAENFKANLYALEVRSRFVDQAHADGYYAGYGNELSATVASNTIKIGSGAFVVQGRMCEVENSESVSVVIENGKYGVVIARIETKRATNGVNFSIIARTGVSKDALKSGLTQEDTYQYSSETTNKVYELPLYYFSMSNGAITLGAKEITAIKEIASINETANNAVSTAGIAVTTASSATKIAEEAKDTAQAASNKVNNIFSRVEYDLEKQYNIPQTGIYLCFLKFTNSAGYTNVACMGTMSNGITSNLENANYSSVSAVYVDGGAKPAILYCERVSSTAFKLHLLCGISSSGAFGSIDWEGSAKVIMYKIGSYSAIS